MLSSAHDAHGVRFFAPGERKEQRKRYRFSLGGGLGVTCTCPFDVSVNAVACKNNFSARKKNSFCCRIGGERRRENGEDGEKENKANSD